MFLIIKEMVQRQNSSGKSASRFPQALAVSVNNPLPANFTFFRKLVYKERWAFTQINLVWWGKKKKILKADT
jgi:hypothetical protein